MLTATEYFNYWRQKAVRHKDLKHNPDSETGNGPSREKRFARISYEEFLTGLHSTCSFPALLAEQFEIVVNGSVESPLEKYSGAITVLATADAESARQIAEASDITLKILTDCVKDMYNDHYGPDAPECGGPFEHLDIDMNFMPVGPVLNGQFGWRCTFYFRMRSGLDITTPAEPGTFINP